MNKKIFAILVVLICALSISTVSADNLSTSGDTSVDDLIGSFTELNNKIINAKDTVVLDKNYTYSDTDNMNTIDISKDLTIDGNGHTIDASNKASIFTIAKDKKVTIKNIIFINGNSTNGGAINNNGTLDICDCKFLNNCAVNGGAINNNGNLYVITGKSGNSIKFLNNCAVNGGAINNNGYFEVMSNNEDKEVKSILEFINNSAIGGGAINNNKTLITDAIIFKFLNNCAVNGGAINNNRTLNLYGEFDFINNCAVNGGAINNNGIRIDIGGVCDYINNSAVNGGVINNNNGTLTVQGVCDYINNSAIYGGAINNNGDLNLYGNFIDALQKFINNSAVTGGVINNNGDLNVHGAKFINNCAVSGGAINNNGTLDVCISEFINNCAVSGGAINNNGTLNINIHEPKTNACEFTDNTAINIGGAIYNNNILTIINSKFTDNMAEIGDDIAVGIDKTIKLEDSDAKITFITSVSINTIDSVVIGENTTISGTVGGIVDDSKVTVTVNDITKDAIVKDGVFSVNIAAGVVGVNEVIVIFTGNNTHAKSSDKANFTVNKVTATIAINPIDKIDAGANITVSGNTTGISNNTKITITVNGKDYTATVEDDKFSKEINNITPEGNDEIIVSYAGNDNVTGAEDKINITVGKYSSIIIFNNITAIVGQNVTVSGTAVPSSANITIMVYGKIFIVTVNEGTFSLNIGNFTKESNQTITAKYDGNENYNNYTVSEVFTVEKKETSPTVTAIVDIADVLDAGDRLVVNATVTSEGKPVNGTVELLINGQTAAKAEAVNGKVSFNVTLYDTGKLTVMVKFAGDDKYGESNDTHDITVKGIATLTVPDITLFFKNGTQLIIYLTSNGDNVSNETVTININGIDYIRTVINGTAKLPINLAPGTYNAIVRLLSDKYNFESTEATVTVLFVIEGNDTVLFFKNGTQYVSLFLDGQGNPLADANIEFNINGIFYYGTSDKNGTIGLDINLTPDNYIITVTNKDNGALHSNNITILPTFISENIVKYYKNETQYVVKVVDGKGIALANQTVEYNINDIFYKRITDANGTASLIINLAAGNSKPQEYIITAWCNGNIVSDTVIVLPVLTADDFNESFEAGKKFTANLVDGQDKPLVGVEIQFNINGVFYNKISDVNGTVELNINLAPGEYIISTICYDNGAVISNKVTVTPKV